MPLGPISTNDVILSGGEAAAKDRTSLNHSAAVDKITEQSVATGGSQPQQEGEY